MNVLFAEDLESTLHVTRVSNMHSALLKYDARKDTYCLIQRISWFLIVRRQLLCLRCLI